MPTKITSFQDGPRLTVNMLAKQPTLIPALVLDMMENEFLVDVVLRKGDDAPSGVVLFFESTPLYTNDDPAILDEFGQIPLTTGSLGTPRAVRTVRRALGIRISKQMMDRNSMDAVTKQLTQLKNTMVRAWEDALFSALLANPAVQTLTTDQPWGSSTSHIRRDVNAAKFVIRNAASDAAGNQKFGFRADTLIISTETEEDFLNSNEVSAPYVGNIASENLKYTGVLPNKFLGLDVVTSWRLFNYIPSGAIVCQRKIVGAISDERALSSTPTYPEGGGGNGGPTESYRSDTTRQSAIAIDQPKALCIITGVTTGETFQVSGGST